MIFPVKITLALVLVLSLFSGCGGGGGDSSTPAGEEPQNNVRNLSVDFLETNTSRTLASSYFKFADNTPVNEDLIPFVNGENNHYLTQCLDGAYIDFNVSVPNDTKTYGSTSNTSVRYVGYVFYPTVNDSNYTSEQNVSGWTIPSQISQMEPVKDAVPIFESSSKKYPLIVYSHGAGGGVLDDTNLFLLRDLAAQGYIVATLFHGDMRFNSYLNGGNTPEDITLRALSIKNLIDFLQTSKYAQNIDFDNIGAFGVSYGGATAFILLGAKPIDQLSATGATINGTVSDSRIKAAVGIVPFMGDNNFPEIMGTLVTFFGYGSSGASSVSKPFLAITGTSDEEAVERYTKETLSKTSANAHLVSMEQEAHGLSINGEKTAQTWGYYFFENYLKNDKTFLNIKDINGFPVDTYINPY